MLRHTDATLVMKFMTLWMLIITGDLPTLSRDEETTDGVELGEQQIVQEAAAAENMNMSVAQREVRSCQTCRMLKVSAMADVCAMRGHVCAHRCPRKHKRG